MDEQEEDLPGRWKRRIEALITTLEQQVCARQHAESQAMLLAEIGGRSAQQLGEMTDARRSLAQLDKPTEYGELYREGDLEKFFGCAPQMRRDDEPEIGSWPWALEQMKAGKRVRRTSVRGNVGLDNDGLLTFSGRYWPAAEDFKAADWQLVKDTATGESEASDE